MLKTITQNHRPLELLSNEQLKKMHKGTMDVLEKTGVRFEHDKALKIFADNGCEVDFKGKIVKIPGFLAEECLKKCPCNFVIEAIDETNNLTIGGNTTVFSQNGGAWSLDLETWETKIATLKDHNDTMRILDALDTCAHIWPYQTYIEMSDIPKIMTTLEAVASGFRNSTKSQTMGHSGFGDEIFAIKMAQALGTGLRGMVTASSPLNYSWDACEAGFRFVDAGFPVLVSSGALMGATGPATIAGSSITNNVELIAGIALLQLHRPGTPVQASDFVFQMNMRHGSPFFGAVGSALHNVIFNQIWRKYGIPTSASYSFTSGKKIDFQAGYERAFNVLISALSGSHFIDLHGSIHALLTYHPVMSILDDDMAGWIGRFIEGVEVSDDTLAIDLIQQIGPMGCYIDSDHTLKWWKNDQFIPKVADLDNYNDWINKGKKDTLELAKERMEEIKETHKPVPLSEDKEKAIGEILKEARTYYVRKGLM